MSPDISSVLGVTYVDHMGSDKKIAQAARTSTKGLDNDQPRVEGLVKALWRDGHYSPFEHCALTVALDVPLFVRDQVVRHKSMSFSVMSGRYTEFKPRFYTPPQDRPLVQAGKALDYRREPGDDEQQWATAARHFDVATEGLWDYRRLLDAGVANEVARNVLPASVYTQMWVTGTLRSWLHFLDQRLDEHAQWEVRQVAGQIAEIIRHIFPIAYQAWNEKRAA